MKFHIDDQRFENGSFAATGWAVPEKGSARLSFSVVGKDGAPVETEVLFHRRPDVSTEFIGDPYREDAGFYITLPDNGDGSRTLVITETEDGKTMAEERIPVSAAYFASREKLRKAKALLEKPRVFLSKVKNKLTNGRAKAYHAWFLRHRMSPEEEVEASTREFTNPPLFSVVVPLYHTPVALFQEMADSVLGQIYGKFEFLPVIAADESADLLAAVSALEEQDNRVKPVRIPKNEGIAKSTNAGILASNGDFVAFLDHDDLLEKDALFRLAEALETAPEADVLYSDEDKVTADSALFYDPAFKPALSPALLYGNQYIGHLTAVRKTRLTEVGLIREGFDGAQDHDLMLRLLDVTDAFVHVPYVLYHWRSTAGSTASGGEKKSYAPSSAKKAIDEAFARLGIAAHAEESGFDGRYRIAFEKADEPLVSILIPNKDHSEDLLRIVDSIYEKSVYRNFEIIVLENNSTEEETFRTYDRLVETHENLRVIAFPGPFHYAKLHNDAMKEAKGDYVLLLNNDMEVLTPDFLTRMMGWMKLPKTAAVGAKLLYPDRTVQHVGIITAEGNAFHPFKGYPADAPGYMCRAVTPMNVSAVTAACMLLKKAVFEEVGGMDEVFSIAMNDVDLCLKMGEKGYRIIEDPDSKLLHFESKSRGLEHSKESFVRFGNELKAFGEKWRDRGVFPDPYYPAVFSRLFAYERKE